MFFCGREILRAGYFVEARMQGKVEICGVNTARLKVLSQAKMEELLLKAKDGDENARQELSCCWYGYLRYCSRRTPCTQRI